MPRNLRRLNKFHPGAPLGILHNVSDDTSGGGVVAGGAGDPDAGSNVGAPDKAFPDNTPVAEMNADQRAAYWQHQARKHEDRVKSRSDYDDLKAKAERFDQMQRESESEHEKALREVREQAKAEATAEVTRESQQKTVRALVDVALRSRGQDDTQIADALRFLNLDAFVNEGEVDTKAIITHAARLAGAGAGDGGRIPDFGQGQRQQTGLSGADLGKAEAARRFAQSNPA